MLQPHYDVAIRRKPRGLRGRGGEVNSFERYFGIRERDRLATVIALPIRRFPAVNARRRLAFADVTSRPRHIRDPPRVKDDGGRDDDVSHRRRDMVAIFARCFRPPSTIDMIGPLSHRVSVSCQRDGDEAAAFPCTATSPSLVSRRFR